MPLVLKTATPQQKSWYYVQLAKNESVRGVRYALRMQFHMKSPWGYSFLWAAL